MVPSKPTTLPHALFVEPHLKDVAPRPAMAQDPFVVAEVFVGQFGHHKVPIGQADHVTFRFETQPRDGTLTDGHQPTLRVFHEIQDTGQVIQGLKQLRWINPCKEISPQAGQAPGGGVDAVRSPARFFPRAVSDGFTYRQHTGASCEATTEPR
jgi:hypothetical protein